MSMCLVWVSGYHSLSLSNDDGNVNEKGKKATGLDWKNNDSACAVTVQLQRENT